MANRRIPLLCVITGISFICTCAYFLLPYQSLSSTPASEVISGSVGDNVKSNLWAELDEVEVRDLYDFLYQDASFNLSKGGLSQGGRHLFVVETLWPDKSTSLRYLAENDASLPERYARVVVADLLPETIAVSDFKVGPLPPSKMTTIKPLTYNSGRNTVHTPLIDFGVFLHWALQIGESIADITSDLLGASIKDDSDDVPDLQFITRPASIDDGRIIHWLEFFLPGLNSDGWSLLPQGLYIKIDTSSPNPEAWKTLDVYYNGILYPNISSFREAWEAPGFAKSRRNSDGAWTSLEDFESTVPGREKHPPLAIQPHGPRYQLNSKQNHVSWMGFSFFLATHQFTGLSLFNIEFRGERIMYEVGLQEALAHYAGSEPLQSGLEWLDAFFGFGATMFSLVPGYDCPAYADYVDMQWHRAERTQTYKNAICIFEFTDHAPLQRHTSGRAVSVSRNTYLVVRSVSTVGNYDYTIDYVFYLDGSIEIKVRASGFIFAAFLAEAEPYRANSSEPLLNSNGEYGHRIHEAVSSSVHDHVLNFKADLDIAGTSSNTFTRLAVSPVSRTYPWDAPEVPASGRRNTMHLVPHQVTHETALNWPRNSNELYLVSSNATNAWGERRSYRITPGTGMGTPAHLTILNSTALGKSAAWSSADLFVLRRHEEEPSSAHHLNFISPHDPLIDFEKMLADNESLIRVHNPELVGGSSREEGGEDLVIYFNLGSHHIPSSSDIPNTLMHTSASSLMFVPHNYFDSDVSRETRQGVRIEDPREKPGISQNQNYERDSKHGKETGKVRYFGGRYSSDQDMLLHGNQLEPDLSGYMEMRGAIEIWPQAESGERLMNSLSVDFHALQAEQKLELSREANDAD